MRLSRLDTFLFRTNLEHVVVKGKPARDRAFGWNDIMAAQAYAVDAAVSEALRCEGATTLPKNAGELQRLIARVAANAARTGAEVVIAAALRVDDAARAYEESERLGTAGQEDQTSNK